MDSKISLWLEAGFFFLMFFVLVPLIAAGIGYAAWQGKPKNSSRDRYATGFAAAGIAAGFLMVYAIKMRADVRTWQYPVEIVLFVLGVVLFGVASGCMVGIFTYRRTAPTQNPPR